MSEQDDRSEAAYVAELLAASKSERPREGAKARALAKMLPELRVAVAVDSPHAMPPRTRLGAALLTTLLVAACVYLGVGIKAQKDLQQAEVAAASSALAAQQAKTDALMLALQGQAARVAELQATVANAKDDAARAVAMRELARATEETKLAAKALRGVTVETRVGAPAKPKPACDCTPGDPLCICIP